MKHLLVLFILVSGCLTAQKRLSKEVKDSLWSVWSQNELSDTSRMNALREYAWNGYAFTQPDSARYFAGILYDFADNKGSDNFKAKALSVAGISYMMQNQLDTAQIILERALKLELPLENTKDLSGIYNQLGFLNRQQGEYEAASQYFKESIQLDRETGNKEGIARGLNNLSIIYREQGNLAQAIVHLTEALQIQEKIDNQAGVASALNNLGQIYMQQNDHDLALEKFKASLDIKEQIANPRSIAKTLTNIVSVYNAEDRHDEAIETNLRVLEIYQELNDTRGIARALGSAGNIFHDQEQNDSALVYYNKALDDLIASGDRDALSTIYANMGRVYRRLGQLQKSAEMGVISLEYAESIGKIKRIMFAAEMLKTTYAMLGKYQDAFEMYDLYTYAKDSVESEENKQEVIRQSYKYEYEKRAEVDSTQSAELSKVKDAVIKAEQFKRRESQLAAEKQEQQKYYLFAILAVALLSGVFVYQRFRISQRQKKEIQEKKIQVDLAFDQLEEKNTEILDSINYAKRIQDAMLPSDSSLKEMLGDAFVLFKPRDIVSGDFYWCGAPETNDGVKLSVFAVADCTGHGVPGAFLSMVGNNYLQLGLSEKTVNNTAEALEYLHEGIMRNLKNKKDKDDQLRDGMDIGICAINFNTLQAEFSGAKNPLFLIRNGELTVIKGDSVAIGDHDVTGKVGYKQHKLDLQKDDTLYLFSDGIVDQFGGERGKKFKTASFKKLLLSIQDESMARQKEILDHSFETWRGDLEQIDDVCVLGIRV